MIYNRSPISKSPKVQQTCLDHPRVRQEAQFYGVGVGGVGDRPLPQKNTVDFQPKQKMSTMRVESWGEIPSASNT